MNTARVVLFGVALTAMLGSQAQAERPGVVPPSPYSPRAVAAAYARSHYGHQGSVSVAKRPLLDTGNVNPLKAYGVSVNGKRLREAVLVRGGFAGYTASGTADVHYVATKGIKAKDLGSTFNEAVILRTRAKGASITAVSNLSKVAEGMSRGTLSAALRPNWPRTCGTPVPGQEIRPQVFPGPASNVVGTAKVSTSRGQTTVTKGFNRFVIMAAGPQ